PSNRSGRLAPFGLEAGEVEQEPPDDGEDALAVSPDEGREGETEGERHERADPLRDPGAGRRGAPEDVLSQPRERRERGAAARGNGERVRGDACSHQIRSVFLAQTVFTPGIGTGSGGISEARPSPRASG